MSADDNAPEQAREVDAVREAIRGKQTLTSITHAALEALAPIRAAERQEAARSGVRLAQTVLAGEDTVDWAREAHTSRLSLGYAMELLDDLIEPDDDRLADAAAARTTHGIDNVEAGPPLPRVPGGRPGPVSEPHAPVERRGEPAAAQSTPPTTTPEEHQ